MPQPCAKSDEGDQEGEAAHGGDYTLAAFTPSASGYRHEQQAASDLVQLRAPRPVIRTHAHHVFPERAGP